MIIKSRKTQIKKEQSVPVKKVAELTPAVHNDEKPQLKIKPSVKVKEEAKELKKTLLEELLEEQTAFEDQ